MYEFKLWYWFHDDEAIRTYEYQVMIKREMSQDLEILL